MPLAVDEADAHALLPLCSGELVLERETLDFSLMEVSDRKESLNDGDMSRVPRSWKNARERNGPWRACLRERTRGSRTGLYADLEREGA